MNRAHRLSHRLVASILLLSLCLQGCLNPSISITPNVKQTTASTQAPNHQNSIKQLVGREFTAEKNHIVTFHEQGGQLRADVTIHGTEDSADPTVLKSLPVRVAKDIDLHQISRLNTEEQKRVIHFNFPKNGQPGRVSVFRAGLQGGMKSTINRSDKKDEEVQEKVIQGESDSEKNEEGSDIEEEVGSDDGEENLDEFNEENSVEEGGTEEVKEWTKEEHAKYLEIALTRLSKIVGQECILEKAIDNGDCFFDALAQCLNEINNKKPYTVDDLRKHCYAYYQANKELVTDLDLGNTSDFKPKKDSTKYDEYEYYYHVMQYTAEKCRTRGLIPMWGRPAVEGQILCRQLGLKGICTIEMQQTSDIDDPLTLIYELVNQEGHKIIDDEELRSLVNAGDIPIIFNNGRMHFSRLQIKGSPRFNDDRSKDDTSSDLALARILQEEENRNFTDNSSSIKRLVLKNSYQQAEETVSKSLVDEIARGVQPKQTEELLLSRARREDKEAQFKAAQQQDEYAADNAFNQYGNIKYLYQCSDIRLIGQHLIELLKDNDIIYIGDIGRGNEEVNAVSVLTRSQEDLKEGQSLAGIYNTGGNHWIAFRIYKGKGDEGIISIYKDSLGEKSLDFEEDIRKALGEDVKFIPYLGREQKLEFEPYEPEIEQRTHTSCGVFALKNMVILAEQGSNKEGKILEFFNPGDNEQQYRNCIFNVRREFAIIYATEIYKQVKAELQACALRNKTKELHGAEAKWILEHLVENKVKRDFITTSIETEEMINSSDDYHYRIDYRAEDLNAIEKILAELVQRDISNISKEHHDGKYILRFSPTILPPESHLSLLSAQRSNRFTIERLDDVDPQSLREDFIQALNIQTSVDRTLADEIQVQTGIDIQIKKERLRNNDKWGWDTSVQPNRKEQFDELKRHRKTKDLKILYEMWDLIRTYKSSGKKGEDAIHTIKQISSLSGGANGIAYNYADDRKSPYDIRNRYGHIQKKQDFNGTNSPETRINFEHLYRINTIIDNAGQVPENLNGVFDQLERKVLYILIREMKEDCLLLEQEKAQEVLALPEQAGDSNELHSISEFVGNYYDEVALDKIKTEVQILENFSKEFDLRKRDSVYFLARKMVVVGELCNELARDSKDNKKVDKELIEILRIMNHIRNGFIHSHSKILLDLSHLSSERLEEANSYVLEFIKDFNKLLSKNILKKGVDKENQKVLRVCLTNLKKLSGVLGRITKYQLKHKLESELLKGKNVLDILTSQEYKSLKCLYQSQQQHLTTAPNVNKIFSRSIEEDNISYLFQMEKNGEVLKELATLGKLGEEIKASLTALKECIRRKNIEIVDEEYKALLENGLYKEILREILLKELGITHVDEFDIREIKAVQAMRALIEKFQDINLEIKKDLKAFSGRCISALTNPNVTLPRLKDINEAYKGLKKECEKLEEAERGELLVKFPFGEISNDTRKEIEELLEETRQERAPTYRVPKLIEKIDKEIDYLDQVKSSNLPEEVRNSIVEYIVTVIGQYVRNIEEIQPLEQALPIWTLSESARTAKLLSTKGLRHEVLYFHQETFQRRLHEDILPAQQDFKALDTINKLLQYPEALKVLEWLAENQWIGSNYEMQLLCRYIGLCFMRLGRLDEALKFYQKVIGPFISNDLDTELLFKSNIMHDIANIYREKGETTAAIKIMKEVIGVFEKVLGSEAGGVLDATHNLGVLYAEAGKSEDAEACYRKVLQYDDLASAKANLASELANKGEYSEAIDLLKGAIKSCEAKVKINLESLLTIYFRLCSIYFDTQRFTDLEECYGKISAIFKKQISGLKAEYGRKYPFVLAKFYREKARLDVLMNRYNRAINIYKEAIEVCNTQRVNDKILPELYEEMGICLICIGELHNAVSALTQAQGIYKGLGMKETIDYALILRSLGYAHSLQNTTKSLLYYEKSLDILAQISAPAKDQARLHYTLFLYHKDAQNFFETKKHMDEFLKLSEKAYSSSRGHIALANSYMEIAKYNLKLIIGKKFENDTEYLQIAEECLSKAYDILSSLDADKNNVSLFFDILCTLSTLYLLKGQYDVSARHSAQAIEISTNNPANIKLTNVLGCYGNLLQALERQNNWIAVRESSRKALYIASQLDNKENCYTISVCHRRAAYRLGYYSEAAKLTEHAISYLTEEDVVHKSTQYSYLGKMQQSQADYIINSNYDSKHAAVWYKKASLSFDKAIKLALQLSPPSQKIKKIQKEGPKKANSCWLRYLEYNDGLTVPRHDNDDRSREQIMTSRIISRIFSNYAMLLPGKGDSSDGNMGVRFKLPSDYKKEHIELAVTEHFRIDAINITSEDNFHSFTLPLRVVREHYEAALIPTRANNS